MLTLELKAMRYKIVLFITLLCASAKAIPVGLLYDFDVPIARYVEKENDISTVEIPLKVPVVFYGVRYNSIYVNSNGFLSFQTEIPHFINIEFPLDYPIIAPFYSNVDHRRAGSISYYETEDPASLERATENVHENFLNDADFQATSLFVVTWNGVGYYNQGIDKVNTFQVVLITDGRQSYAEFLYPENGIQWIQGTGDDSGLPDARAQVGLLSADGKMHNLPGSGTEQVRNLEKWSNMGLVGQFIYRIDGKEITEPDAYGQSSNRGLPQTCAESPTACHSQARCIDYKEGFCCECNPKYYGNGKYCVKDDLPLRVTGKVNGKINGEKLENLDLQSYIVTTDGRAYTAISKVPESIGSDVQTLQILGGVIGYLFAKPIRGAQNGFQITGGLVNHSATITFFNSSQVAHINQKFLGLDVFDQLRVEVDIQGEIPTIPADARVIIDEYQEQYTQTGYDLIQMSSERPYIYSLPNGDEITNVFKVEQTFRFDYCPLKNTTLGTSYTLKVGRNFISYESREQIIRFGLSNKITPIGEYDPCEEGRQRCGANSACVVEGNAYECVCNPGYQRIYSGSEEVCADINECQTYHECDHNAQCSNAVGSYQCTCNPGFEGNGRVCTPVSSCANITCTENAECIESGEIANCRCLPGFRGDGYICHPVTSQGCEENNNCSPYGICSIDPRTNQYSCSCIPGFYGDGYTCYPIPTTTEYAIDNEEVTTEQIRKEIQRCLLGVCWCPEGYTIEQGTQYCLPPTGETEKEQGPERNESDELESPEIQCYNATICICPENYFYSKSNRTCMLSPNPNRTIFWTKGPSNVKYDCRTLNNCDYNARCLPNEELQRYMCTCNEGFEGDGFMCQKEEESCTTVNNCDTHATCAYDENVGKSRCVCNPGFRGDGQACAIVAGCESNRDCAPTEECLYQNNRYECVCREGHIRDSQYICIPQEATCGGGTCVENAECLFDDDYQTHYCTCKPGYIGDGITECKLKPIGCDTLNNCGLHATCQYEEQELTYVCRCNSGFFGDGFNCYVERNCHVDPSMCDPNAQCYADANRRYVCQCNPSYVGNGTICKEISRAEGNFLLLNQGMATLKIPMEPTKRNPGKPIQVKLFQTAVGLDIDCMEGRVYWTDISGRAIRSSSYNGSDKIDFIFNHIGSPEGLAVDWVSRNIYWTDSTFKTIEVANLDSKRRRSLFSNGLVNPRGIAVHPQRGKIFWSDWNRAHPKIEWSNADGTDRKTFLEGSSVSLPNSLAIDYDTEQLCFSDAGTKKIECVQIDNRQIQTIAVNCTYPFGIAITDKLVYWSDWISKKIERVDKYALTRLPPLNVPVGGSGNKLFGLVAVPNSCPSLTNICQYNRCPEEHICLPDGKGSKTCLCARRSDVEDETNCII